MFSENRLILGFLDDPLVSIEIMQRHLLDIKP